MSNFTSALGHSTVPFVFGVIGTLLFVLYSFYYRPRRAARRILMQMRALFGQPHEYRQAKIRDFPFLDKSHYENSQRQLEEADFRTVADHEDLTATKYYPNGRTLVRVMIGDEGATRAEIAHIKQRGVVRLFIGRNELNWRAFFFTTEFTDGTFLATSNTQNTPHIDSPPEFDGAGMDLDTPLPTVLMFHRSRLRKKLDANPDLRVEHLNIYHDCLELDRRMQEARIRWREAHGFFTPAELIRLGGVKYNSAARLILPHVERLLAHERE